MVASVQFDIIQGRVANLHLTWPSAYRRAEAPREPRPVANGGGHLSSRNPHLLSQCRTLRPTQPLDVVCNLISTMISVRISFVGGKPLRVSREKARENRKRVVSASSTLFRQNGVDGVAIGELMSDVGLTHGGFYKQFGSKAELVQEACAAALQETLAFWDGYLGQAEDPQAAFIQAYLSQRHRDEVATGCLLPALAGEARREPEAVREVFVDAIQAYADRLDQPVNARSDRSRQRALATLSSLVGALILSRASNEPQLSEEILDATRSHILSACVKEAQPT